MQRANSPAAIVFDAYGTLFDVMSVGTLAEGFWGEHADALVQLWRRKQLEYTWLQSLMVRHDDFAAVTTIALDFAAESLGLALGETRRAALLRAYRELDCFPDVPAALDQLQDVPLVILSNGTPEMLSAVVEHNGLSGVFSSVLSVESAGIYKPSPAVYQLAVDHLHVAPADVVFVSSNGWDATGAKSFGFETFWLNRAGAPPERHGPAPDRILTSLAELPPLLRH